MRCSQKETPEAALAFSCRRRSTVARRRLHRPSPSLGYDIRHSYATAVLAAGIPAKHVSGPLGHANITITMHTYGHVLPGLDKQAGTISGLTVRCLLRQP
jgi:integrase